MDLDAAGDIDTDSAAFGPEGAINRGFSDESETEGMDTGERGGTGRGEGRGRARARARGRGLGRGRGQVSSENDRGGDEGDSVRRVGPAALGGEQGLNRDLGTEENQAEAENVEQEMEVEAGVEGGEHRGSGEEEWEDAESGEGNAMDEELSQGDSESSHDDMIEDDVENENWVPALTFNLLAAVRAGQAAGHGTDSDSDSGDVSDTSADFVPTAPMTYDSSRPAAHEYLGAGESMGGHLLIPPGDKVLLTVFPLQNIVLFPGQTIPLRFIHGNGVAGFKQMLEEGKRIFGVLNFSLAGVASYGTTADILTIRHLEDGTVNVVAKGRQRFRVLSNSSIRWSGPNVTEVEILGDSEPPHIPICNLAHPVNSDKDEEGADEFGVVRTCVPAHGKPGRRTLRAEEGIGRPLWLLRQYDEQTLALRALQMCRAIINPGTAPPPDDPLSFSYWLAVNLPIRDDARVDLLTMGTAVERLQQELSFLTKLSALRCSYCSKTIAQSKNIFTMSVEGPQQAYVNAHGYVHEMITVRKATNVFGVGEPSSENSWFPGYAWTILYCRECRSHLGWMFTAETPDLFPRTFFGIRRASLR